MIPFLLAQITERAIEIAPWHIAVLVLGIIGLILIRVSFGQSKPTKLTTLGGFVALTAAFGINVASLPWGIEQSLLVTFGWLAVVASIAFVSFRTPVYAALSFTAIVLDVCGIYILNTSPFLAASTMIVYAGATIIIFLFVLMFAQRSQLQAYDLTISMPRFSLLAGLAVFSGLLYSIFELNLSEPKPLSEQKVESLGKLMFTDYLWSVEIAGVLLLIAAIAAILIAQDNEPDRLLESEISKSTHNQWDGAKS
jgi:NADH-quinone oxidoreductase subunit J